MLANPVVIPAYADPVIWVLAFVAMWAEVRSVLWVMRRLGSDVRGLLAPIFAINIATWFSFLIAVHWVDRAGLPIAFALTSLEVVVVVIEAALLHSATRGRVFTRGLPCTPLTWPRAVLVSFAGNVVSVAVSIVLPIGLVWLLERRWP
jgi:hypothetical protein